MGTGEFIKKIKPSQRNVYVVRGAIIYLKKICYGKCHTINTMQINKGNYLQCNESSNVNENW